MGKCEVSDVCFKTKDVNGYLIGFWVKKSIAYEISLLVFKSVINSGCCRFFQHAQMGNTFWEL